MRSKLAIIIVGIFGFLLSNFAAYSQSNSTKKLGSSIDSLLLSQLHPPFSGVIIIQQNGKNIYTKKRGYADWHSKQIIKSDAQFVIGSLSKQITAVLVMRAVEKGLLDLDEKVGVYLPDFEQAWKDSITVHQLLNHTSGVRNFDDALAFRPGSQFSYSNWGYELIGQILSSVYQKSYAELAQELFQDNGMKWTATPETGKTKRLVKGWYRAEDQSFKLNEKPFANNSIPAALIVSCAKDLSKWNEKLHSGKLLNAKSYAQFTRPSSTRDHPIFGDVDYAYGIQMSHNDGLYEISHGGYVEGFISVNFYYPESKTSLIVLANLDWKDPTYKDSFEIEMRIRSLLRNWLIQNKA